MSYIRHEMVIDYTNIATPITVERAYEDIQAAALSFGDDAVRFVMWEHQWDWMLKEADVEDTNYSYLYDDGGRWLWGHKVELADEPKPVAVISVDTPLSDEEAQEIRERFEKIVDPRATFVHTIRAEQQAIVDRAKEEKKPSVEDSDEPWCCG